jgi:hypothetical protein
MNVAMWFCLIVPLVTSTRNWFSDEFDIFSSDERNSYAPFSSINVEYTSKDSNLKSINFAGSSGLTFPISADDNQFKIND